MAQIPPSPPETIEQKLERLRAETVALKILIIAGGDPTLAEQITAQIIALNVLLQMFGIPPIEV